MRKALKIIATISIACVLIMSVISYTIGKRLSHTCTPSWITEKLSTITGYDVSIEGPMAWEYIFTPHVSIEKIAFKSQGETLIELEHVTLHPNFFALLQKKTNIAIKFQHWRQHRLNFYEGSAQIQYDKDTLILKHIDTQCYQGQLSGEATVNLHNTLPEFEIKLKLTHAKIEDFLGDIANTHILTGEMDANVRLHSMGKNTTEFLQSLSGNIHIDVMNGQLKEQKNTFDQLEVNTQISDGIAHNHFKLLAKNYYANGEGSINLITEALDLQVKAYYTHSKKTKNTSIPIHITGTLASPQVDIDLATPLSQLLHTDKNKLLQRLHHIAG